MVQTLNLQSIGIPYVSFMATTTTTTTLVSSFPSIFSTIPSLTLKSLRFLQPPSTSSLFHSASYCKFGADVSVCNCNEALTIAAATEAVVLRSAAVEPAVIKDVVLGTGIAGEAWFDGGSGSGNRVERDRSGDDLKARRKKRRKRRNGFEYCLEVKEERVRGPGKIAVLQSVKSGGYLSPSEEAELCQCLKDNARIEAARRRIAEAQKHEPTSKQLAEAVSMENRSVEKILCKGRESRERIIRSYLRLIVSIATGYRGRGLTLQDLIQEGSIGLLRGAEKFDPRRGYKLSTYVYWWIKEAIITAISNKSRIVRLPKSAWGMVAKIAEANDALRRKLRRSPSYDEIAEVLDVHVSIVRLGFERSKSPISLDQAVAGRDCMTFLEIIPGPDEAMPEKMVRKQLMRQELEKLIQTVLSEREAYILRLNFGLNGQTPQSFEEIARLLKLSRERVRQINSTALSKLRQRIIMDHSKVDIA